MPTILRSSGLPAWGLDLGGLLFMLGFLPLIQGSHEKLKAESKLQMAQSYAAPVAELTLLVVASYPSLSIMPDRSASEIKLLRTAYTAFNLRDIDAALATMAPDVAWPKAFKGGFVRGPEEIRAYWTEQWSEINPHVEPMAFYPEDAGRILVDVHQVVRDLSGALLADEHVGHRFTLAHGLIQAMEIGPLPSSPPKA